MAKGRKKKEDIETPIPDEEVPKEPIEDLESTETPIVGDKADEPTVNTDKEPDVQEDAVTGVEDKVTVKEEDTAPVNEAQKGAKTIRDMDIKEEWKEKLIESEMKSLAEMPEGVAKDVILIQYRDKEGDPLENALITHSRQRLMDAWDFYKDNIPDAKKGKFLESFIQMAGVGRTSYKKIHTLRLE